MGGNRKGKIRKYINTLIVFAISGLWHGASYHFIIWGIINGLFVIIGQVLKPLKKAVYKFTNISEDLESVKLCKRIIVFWLITITWVFFNNGIGESLHIIKNIVFLNPIKFFDQNLFSISGSVAATFNVIVLTLIFLIVQTKRQNEALQYKIYSKQPLLFQTVVIGFIICICVLGACSTDATVNTQFLYFQF